MTNSLGRLPGWLRECGAWLAWPRRAWIAIFAIAAIVAVFFVLPGCAERRIRLAGLLLELLGVGTVAKGINDTRKRFGKPSLLREWLAAAPKWRRDIQIIAGTGNMNLSGVRASAVGTVTLPADASADQRIRALETLVQNLHAASHALRTEFEKAVEDQRNALTAETQTRRDEDASVRKLIDDAIAGGLSLEAMGLLWLVVGVVLATGSAEFAAFLGAAACR